MMSNTGSNFYSRFGDRLPTREVKSRRGKIATSQGGRASAIKQMNQFESPRKRGTIDSR